jgi:uncharacterized membrane protein
MSWTAFWYILPISFDWMRWNLFLALIPLSLSIGLFQVAPQRSRLWWLGLITFVAFLPNAPYILTDVIHLVEEIQGTPSLLFNSLIVVPRYALFLLLGFSAYVLSVVNVGLYLKRQGLNRWVLPVEWGLHGLSAIGVNLGRFDRFNSWDLWVKPGPILLEILQDLTRGKTLSFIAIATLVIAGLYWVGKQITLALILRYQMGRTPSSADSAAAPPAPGTV